MKEKPKLPYWKPKTQKHAYVQRKEVDSTITDTLQVKLKH